MALPDRQREVLTLHDIGGAGHAEVAETLGISEGNARVPLHRARWLCVSDWGGIASSTSAAPYPLDA
jgi:DNA-directed RNA polymerase specialized sigma24 family protein